jgi:hypothetical protein
MMTKVTEISQQDLGPVSAARAKAVELAKGAEEAIKDARLAEMEFKITIQQLYLEKGLAPNCRVDLGTGVVTWPEEEVEEPTVAEKPRKKRSAKKNVETESETEGSTE